MNLQQKILGLHVICSETERYRNSCICPIVKCRVCKWDLLLYFYVLPFLHQGLKNKYIYLFIKFMIWKRHVGQKIGMTCQHMENIVIGNMHDQAWPSLSVTLEMVPEHLWLSPFRLSRLDEDAPFPPQFARQGPSERNAGPPGSGWWKLSSSKAASLGSALL